MKKTYNHTVLSTSRCSCGRHLKKRLVESKPTLDKCYKCHVKLQARRGHQMYHHMG